MKKIIKILLKIILWLILGILSIGGIILIIIGSKGLKLCINDGECFNFKLSINSKIYDSFNLLKEEHNYINGIENGPFYYYYEGKLTGKGQYINGKLDGVINSYYYENGNIKEIRKYENGKLDGKFFEYYENGSIKEEGSYNNGEKVGTRTGYYKTGNINYIENYNNGKLDGEFFEYYENGSIKEEGLYNNGEKVGTRKEYIENGYLFNTKIF